MENINLNNARFYVDFALCGLTCEEVLGLFKFANLDSWLTYETTKVNNFGKATSGVVSPIMSYEDLSSLVLVLDLLKSNGAYVNKTCYIHVHVYENDFSYEHCINLCNLTIPKERLFLKALNVIDRKVSILDKSFIDRINVYKAIGSLEDFRKAWYEYIGKEDYSKACIDFHDFFNGKGLSINYFNGSLEYIEFLAYIDLSVGLVQKAHFEKCKPWTRHNDSNEARQWVDFLWGMGIRGKNPRFKATRAILTRYLEGNPWK